VYPEQRPALRLEAEVVEPGLVIQANHENLFFHTMGTHATVSMVKCTWRQQSLCGIVMIIFGLSGSTEMDKISLGRDGSPSRTSAHGTRHPRRTKACTSSWTKVHATIEVHGLVSRAYHVTAF